MIFRYSPSLTVGQGGGTADEVGGGWSVVRTQFRQNQLIFILYYIFIISYFEVILFFIIYYPQTFSLCENASPLIGGIQ